MDIYLSELNNFCPPPLNLSRDEIRRRMDTRLDSWILCDLQAECFSPIVASRLLSTVATYRDSGLLWAGAGHGVRVIVIQALLKSGDHPVFGARLV